MSTASGTQFKRNILDTANAEKASAILQQNLTNLVDLALVLKQAHWNVVGPNFRSIHLQLDEIVETVRNAGTKWPRESPLLEFRPTVVRHLWLKGVS